MTKSPPEFALEHAEDVFRVLAENAGEECALAILSGVEGGGVRAPGAVMGVTTAGQRIGYLSGGCIDADVATHAAKVIETGEPVTLRYGVGSPFLDIRLPCGGGLDVRIVSLSGEAVDLVRKIAQSLRDRSTAILGLTPEGRIFDPNETSDERANLFHYRPKMRLRIVGRSADPIALAQIASAAGAPTIVQSTDPECLKAAPENVPTQIIRSGSTLGADDDPWTAIVLMMHDRDWETAILREALDGPAFFVGAVGGRRAQEERIAVLREAGVSEDKIARIRGPVGLVPSMREASMLAVSVLAEIIDAYHQAA